MVLKSRANKIYFCFLNLKGYFSFFLFVTYIKDSQASMWCFICATLHVLLCLNFCFASSPADGYLYLYYNNIRKKVGKKSFKKSYVRYITYFKSDFVDKLFFHVIFLSTDMVKCCNITYRFSNIQGVFRKENFSRKEALAWYYSNKGNYTRSRISKKRSSFFQTTFTITL